MQQRGEMKMKKTARQKVESLQLALDLFKDALGLVRAVRSVRNNGDVDNIIVGKKG